MTYASSEGSTRGKCSSKEANGKPLQIGNSTVGLLEGETMQCNHRAIGGAKMRMA